MRTPILLLVTLTMILPLGVARGEEDAAAKTALESALSTFPAPSAEHAFTFEGQAVLNGAPFGTVAFEAQPAEDGTAWRVSDRFTFGGGAFVRASTVLLDRRLQPISGRVEGKEPGTDGFEITWKRTDAGFSVKHTATKAGETTTSERSLEHTGPVTSTMTSLFLFARLSGLAEGSYAVTVFDPDPGQGDPVFETATWTQSAEGTWNGTPALLVEASKGKKHTEAAFDPKTHALLGTRLKSEAQGIDMTIQPAPAEPEATDDVFARAARDAREVAMQAGLAFAVADLELTERVLHWPSIHAQAAAQHTGEDPFPDLETFKARTLENLEESLTPRPRPMIENVLKMVEDQLTLEGIEGGFTKVTFPPLFKGLVMTVGEIDGRWLLVRMPSTPK